jgi:hypothetical protein
MSYQRMSRWGKKLLMMGALATLLAGCSSTIIRSTRHLIRPAVAPFSNVTVVGVDERPKVREAFENDAAALLRERGVQGLASYTQFSFDEVKDDQEQVRRGLLAAKAEAVLFVRVTQQVDFEEGPPASPGSMDTGALDEPRQVALIAPVGQINTNFRLWARLYRVSDGAAIWSAVLDEVMKEDDDSRTFIRNTAKTIVERMARDKVIP